MSTLLAQFRQALHRRTPHPRATDSSESRTHNRRRPARTITRWITKALVNLVLLTAVLAFSASPSGRTYSATGR